MKKLLLAVGITLIAGAFIVPGKKQVAQPKIYAMVIGISTFKDNQIPNLKYADKDAVAFAEFLKTPNAGAIPPANISLLTNEQATRSAILKQLLQLFSRANKDDLIIFYFSGHGQNGEMGKTGYFLTYDTESDNAFATALSMDEVNSAIRNCEAKMKLSYIDACHAGLFLVEANKKGTAVDNGEIIKAYMQGLLNSDGGAISFLSSSARQQSVEDETLGHGVFTHYLIKGLQGEADKEQQGAQGYDDGVVSAGELQTYLSNKISSATKFKQKPTVLGEYDEEFPMSIIRPGMNFVSELVKHSAKEKKPEQAAASNGVGDPGNGMDVNTAQATLDRAVAKKDGSMQGQVQALEVLLKNKYEFSAADFRGVSFKGANISNGNFSTALFDLGNLSATTGTEANLSEAVFNFTDITNAKFTKANFSNSTSSFINGYKAAFAEADLTNARFFSADLRQANFTGADLRGTRFSFCDLRGAIFDKSKIEHAGFYGCLLDSAVFTGATILNTEFNGSVARNFNLTKQQREGACRYNQPYDNRENSVQYHEQYKIRLVEQLASSKFNSGYEYRDFLNINTAYPSFAGSTLPFCSIKQPYYNDDYRYSYNLDFKDIFFHDVYLRKGTRVNDVTARVKSHQKLLDSFLQSKYTMVNAEKIDKWKLEMEKAFKETKKSYLPYISTDYLLVCLLERNVLNKQQLDWPGLAYEHVKFEAAIRQANEGKFDQHSGWKPVYPAGVAPAYLPSNWDDLYKTWTLARAAAKNDLLVDKTSQYTYNNSSDILIPTTTFKQLYSASNELAFFKDKQIDIKRVIQPGTYLFSQDLYNHVYLVVPENLKGKDLLFKIPEVAGKINKGDEVSFDMEWTIEKMEQLKLKDNPIVLIFVIPKAVWYRFKGESTAKRVANFELVESKK